MITDISSVFKDVTWSKATSVSMVSSWTSDEISLVGQMGFAISAAWTGGVGSVFVEVDNATIWTTLSDHNGNQLLVTANGSASGAMWDAFTNAKRCRLRFASTAAGSGTCTATFYSKG